MELVPGYSFDRAEPLSGGLSGDEKSRVWAPDGREFLLRVSDADQAARKRAEYGLLARAWAAGCSVPRPEAFGVCGAGARVYQLAAWIPGRDVRAALREMSGAQRRCVGLRCGALLKSLHAIPSPGDAAPWGARLRGKIAARAEFYGAHPIRTPGADALLAHLLNCAPLAEKRPQTFGHGDFNPENIILSPDGAVWAIDFNAYNLGYGDPWWELCAVIPGEAADGAYLTGLIDGYFGAPPPEDFFPVLRYYFAYSALAALCDTSVGDGGEPEDGRRHVADVLSWFDGLRAEVPTWYERRDDR